MRLLNKDEIECKVKQITANGCLILLYKTARVDMAILDEEFGAENWQSDYKVVNDNLYCGIGVFRNNQWVWKWDCGIESREDGEGNEKKGEASDAFKRAGFKWGIGRELYTTPFIWCKVPVKQVVLYNKTVYKLLDEHEKFKVQEIGYDENKNINKLIITDSKNNIVYNYDNGKTKTINATNNNLIEEVKEVFPDAQVIPTYEDVVAYIAEKQYMNVNAQSCIATFEKAGWKNRYGKPLDWKKSIDFFEENNKNKKKSA